MSAKISIPSPMRAYAGGLSEVELKAGSLRQGFEELFERFPDLRRHLCNEDGTLRRFLNLYLNDEDIRCLGESDSSIHDVGVPFTIENEHVRISYSPPIGNDYISIVPSIAGGHEPHATRG